MNEGYNNYFFIQTWTR